MKKKQNTRKTKNNIKQLHKTEELVKPKDVECELVEGADGAKNTSAASIVADRADFRSASFAAVALCERVADNVTIYGLLYYVVI